MSIIDKILLKCDYYPDKSFGHTFIFSDDIRIVDARGIYYNN